MQFFERINQLTNSLSLALYGYTKYNGLEGRRIYLYSHETSPQSFFRKYAFHNAHYERPKIAGFEVKWRRSDAVLSTLEFQTTYFSLEDIKVPRINPKKLVEVIANILTFVSSQSPVVVIYVNGNAFSKVEKI